MDYALKAGLSIDSFAPRLSFFFNAHNHLFEEVAKYRVARKIWAETIKEYGAKDPNSMKLRFHAQTGGSTLTAQQVTNNVARVTTQAMSAVLGGAQSLHTNGMDEALQLPTEEAVRVALRTQQIIANESGVTDTVDPLGGAHAIEYLTDEIERRAGEVIAQIDRMGGAVAAIEAGWMQAQIAEAAYRHQQEVERGERVVVGVNAYKDDRRPATDDRQTAVVGGQGWYRRKNPFGSSSGKTVRVSDSVPGTSCQAEESAAAARCRRARPQLSHSRLISPSVRNI